jgi:hypothetical protein
VLRLLILKHVRNWSYDVLEREVRANLVYRDFTRVGGAKMPGQTNRTGRTDRIVIVARSVADDFTLPPPVTPAGLFYCTIRTASSKNMHFAPKSS